MLNLSLSYTRWQKAADHELQILHFFGSVCIDSYFEQQVLFDPVLHDISISSSLQHLLPKTKRNHFIQTRKHVENYFKCPKSFYYVSGSRSASKCTLSHAQKLAFYA